MAGPDTPKEIVKRFAERATLMPGLSEPEIAAVERRVGVALPEHIKDLLRYAAGLHVPSVGTVHFGGRDAVELPGVFVRSVTLLADGSGNFWVTDINPHSGEWGAVFFVCHDPPVLAIQAAELGAFILQVLAPADTNPRNALTYIRNKALPNIWKNDPWLISPRDARRSPDPLTSHFAAQVSDAFHIVDLRSREIGSGFSWGAAGPDAAIRRAGAELLFAVERKRPGLLKRILGAKP